MPYDRAAALAAVIGSPPATETTLQLSPSRSRSRSYSARSYSTHSARSRTGGLGLYLNGEGERVEEEAIDADGDTLSIASSSSSASESHHPHYPPGSFAARVRELLPPTVVALYDYNYGLFLIAAAQFFFAAMSLSVKYLIESTNMSTLTLIFVRMGITGLCCFVTLLIQGDPNPVLGPPGVRRALVARGCCGFGGLMCAYQALRGLSVSDAVTIQFLSPCTTAALAYFFLGESFTLREAGAAVLSLVGVVLVSRPPFIFGHGWDAPEPAPDDEARMDRMTAVTWAMTGVLFASSAYLLIRYIGKRANALHSIQYFSVACTLACGVAMVFTPNLAWPHDRFGFVLIFIIGIFGFIAQALLTHGLQNEKAGRAGIATYLQIFFAVILELLAFGKIPSFLSLLGTIIILTSAYWVASASLKTNPPPRVEDPEAAPISRSTSPLPIGSKTVRGEHYSYASVPTDDAPQNGYGNPFANGNAQQQSSSRSASASPTLRVPSPNKV